MPIIDFRKYKEYLESINYKIEKVENYPFPLSYNRYIFNNGTDDRYYVIVFLRHDNMKETNAVASICHGPGSIYSGTIKKVNIDFRKKFWKEMKL